MSDHMWSNNVVASLLLVGVLALLPLAGWLEQQTGQTWTNRLALPNLLDEPDRHTPYQIQGMYLPPVIAKDTTLTPDQNPILLRGTVTVAPHTTLTLAPGTEVWIFEFGTLDVQGTLQAKGTATQSIQFKTNEQHPLNQTWNGIIFQPGSQGEVAYTQLDHSSPAISCLKGATVKIAHAVILDGSLGIYSQSADCTVQDSLIRGARTGITTVGYTPNLDSNRLLATQSNQLVIP